MNIQNFIDAIRATVESHKLENEGEYARYLWQNEKNDRIMGVNPYGCADAINILYTINEFPRDLEVRKKHVDVLQSLQDSETGLFTEDTHHPIHTTAHCTAALELFDALPLYKFKALNKYKTIDGLYDLLEGLDWENKPWPESHQGAGIYAALKLNDETTPEWENAYFKWFWDNADPEFGFWKKGIIDKDITLLYQNMAGGFHYMFNHSYAKMPLRYPEKIIDKCLDLYYNTKNGQTEGLCIPERLTFGKKIGFLEIDWVFSISRALRQCGYRHKDCIEAIRDFANDYIKWLNSLDYTTDDQFNDLHMLFGVTCALAEIQATLPGEFTTTKPLRLVLDRRPFI